MIYTYINMNSKKNPFSLNFVLNHYMFEFQHI